MDIYATLILNLALFLLALGGGGCSVRSSQAGSTFMLRLSGFTPEARRSVPIAAAAGGR
jgi:hypothetical protein